MQKILLSSALCATIAFGGVDVLPVEKRTFSQSQYVPDISVVMDASYVNRNLEDAEVAHLEVPGVTHTLLGSHEHDGDSHSPYNANEGFNLNYAELVLSSSVDPFFTMDSVFHFSEDGVEIEELYFTSTALGHGATLKGGKFNSSFGYINEQHHHTWSFSDMPLVYESFLGMHGLNEIGLQLQWLAPTSQYLMFGIEVLQGENEQMFGNGAISANVEEGGTEEEHEGHAHELSTIESAASAPSLFVAYAKTSFDVDNTTILAGVSFAKGSSRIDHSSDEEDPHAFSGDSTLYGADLVVKHYLDSYSSITWQSEYLYRDMDGTQYNFNEDTEVISSPALTKNQSGLYSQLIYAPNKTWQMGVRYDAIYKNDITANNIPLDKPNNLNKYSAMVEYHTSEFARFRLQYNENNALYNEDGNKEKVRSLILQANISIGAHGAHSF